MIHSQSIRLPHPLYEKILARAKVNHRSLNAEMIVMLEAAVQAREEVDVDQLKRLLILQTQG